MPVCYSETETSFYVAEPPVPSFRATLVQSIRLAAQHQLSRGVVKPNAQVCATTMHRVTVP